MPDDDFASRVAEVLHQLGPGDVMTYGEVALEAGSPGAHRAVGSFLRDHGSSLPWWRVVRADGRLAASDTVDQAARLRREGVTVVDGRVRFASPATQSDTLDPT